jgi:protein-serine/threonine kinase
MPANTANQNMDLDIGDRSIPMRGSPSLSPTAMLKGTDVNANGRLVILTPTTQEWRELGFEHLRDLGGEGVEGESDSERERKRSLSSTDSEGMEDFGWNVVPKLSRTHSADVLGAVDESERSRSISGCNVLGIANDGHEESVILTVPPPTSGTTTLARGLRGTSSRASSRRSSIPEEPRSAPPLLEEGDLFAKLIGMQLEEAERQKEAVGSEPISRKTSPQPPQNSTSPGIGIPIGEPSMTIGRSQSMRETGEGPKRKERERERLFRLVGEEVEKNGIQKPARGWGIKQIGNGGGLAALSPASPTQSEPSPTEKLGLRPALFEGRSISSPGDLVDIPKPTIGLQGDRKPKSTLPKKLSSSVSQIGGLSMTSVKPTAAPSPLHASTVPPPESFSEPNSNPASRSGTRIHSRSPTYSANHPSNSPPAIVRPVSPITSRRRQSQRLSSLAGRTPQPFAFPAALPPSHPMNRKPNSNLLSAFSPFTTTGSSKPAAARPEMSREPSAHPLLSVPHYLQPGDRSDSMISIAPSTRAPSEPGTPLGETVGGMGGHGIDDYVIISEAGKGAYGLVKRARQRGWDGEPMGDEVIIKYIIKSRILADCWKK